MHKAAAMKRNGAVMGVTIAVLCVLLVAFSYYHATRATISPYGELSLWDSIVMNSDIIMGLVFLFACSVPFFLKFERRKPRAREMVPLAVMAALGVVGRTVFQLIPLPNFKPVSAIVIITAIAFGPEAGFMTGAHTAFVSNFIFGQGPWTPWQMFCWGMIGFVAGRLQNRASSGAKAAAALCFACVGQNMPREHIARGYAALCAWHKRPRIVPPVHVRAAFGLRLRVGYEPLLHNRLHKSHNLAKRCRGVCFKLFL